jgi:streptomycin 6-kinase
MCDQWADWFELDSETDSRGLDPGLAREGIATLRELPRTADRSVLLWTDLHAGNVLASQREPWLVIDPQPFIGDPAYEPVQHILNCDERLATDPAGLARGWRSCSTSLPSVSGYGCSPAASRSRSTTSRCASPPVVSPAKRVRFP